MSAYPVLFLKTDTAEWAPVGEEELFTVVEGKDSTAAVVVCDREGNSKAITAWVSPSEAREVGQTLAAKGMSKFEGEVRLPT